MISIIILLVINSLLCLGFWNACYYNEENESESGVLWFIDKWASNKFFYKPLCGCLPCMSSIHSIYTYWIYMISIEAVNLNALLFYPVYILALSGLNRLINNLV